MADVLSATLRVASRSKIAPGDFVTFDFSSIDVPNPKKKMAPILARGHILFRVCRGEKI
jgi:hypothetical protein